MRRESYKFWDSVRVIFHGISHSIIDEMFSGILFQHGNQISIIKTASAFIFSGCTTTILNLEQCFKLPYTFPSFLHLTRVQGSN